MLTSETKQKINNCRDYLVWKIPDPKWQIDQITNALIYKFMSDQDRLAKEIGWNASFFVDQWEKESEKYAKYSWEHLFDTKLTNEAKARLYIDGIEQLSKAKHLPELFRDIFKDAFLPFRDSNTIVLFLTEINKFDYHHSEELGNAFEYLLSIMWSQWNAGQFRTPRHIIDFLVDVVDPKPGETIYDPACGTAGFLISAFTHIMENNPKLSVPEKLELYKNISWVDIDPGMAKIARVNLYLHGFKTPKISEDDTLSNIKLWDNKYDVIFANPPFMTPKWGIKVHEWYSIKSTKAEVLFTDYIAEHLRLKWRAGIIVPEGIIFQSANAYKDLRKMLVEQNLLYAVVSLPSWIFQPYSWVKTSILFLDRELASKTDKILFVKVENDWYDLWAQRREINKNDLPKTLQILKNYKASILENKNFETDDKNVLVVEKSKIAHTGEYNLSWERYRETIAWKSSFKMVELSNICDLFNGFAFKSTDYVEEKTNTLNIRMSNIRPDNKFDPDYNPKYLPDDFAIKYKDYLLTDWDLIIAMTDMAGEPKILGVPTLVINKWNRNFLLNQRVWKLIDIDLSEINIKYFSLILWSDKIKEYYKSLWWGWVQINIWKKDILSAKIPLPPLEIQEQIVEELDNYQKIIDGAEQVVENYKPKIKIDESWEVVELGEITSFIRWPFWWSLKKEIFVDDWYLVYEQYHAINDDYTFWRYFIDENKFNEMRRFEVFAGDILISCSWTMWKISIVPNNNKKWIINQALLKLTPNFSKITSIFLKLVLESDFIQNKHFKSANWAWIPNLPWVNILKQIQIPLPPLEIQEQIVAKIEEEQKMVESAKWLIEIFESKIKEKIWEVWGENLDGNI